MAQGAVKPKKSSAPASSGRKAKPQPPKSTKGARVSKAKNASSADKLQRRLAAGLVAKTEKLLGERAGHLELIGKGRVKGDKDGKDKDGKGTAKGGSRKFG
ncbi:uncharacterized protein F4817DRAFT_250076 [Daldinia loculata]|uniref:uncharacterized protein n=1 Tax=Daldinia loculata TaxID=103429 RepID=UPI0020C2E851|nr:uncharacterized protein F4817DRAFT_250076 [Daldinia loculata]KAI1643559.1 hypothetical protein F4817DRAFT_250076 [Daldinia loculata]